MFSEGMVHGSKRNIQEKVRQISQKNDVRKTCKKKAGNPRGRKAPVNLLSTVAMFGVELFGVGILVVGVLGQAMQDVIDPMKRRWCFLCFCLCGVALPSQSPADAMHVVAAQAQFTKSTLQSCFVVLREKASLKQ